MEYGGIMRNIALILILVCFAGCTTTQWNQVVWGNPKGAWWKNPPEPQQTQYGAICITCKRSFTVPAEMYQRSKEVVCPFCGVNQDTQMAMNRYTYESQQQQQAANQAFWQKRQETLQRRREEEQKASEERKKWLSTPSQRQSTYTSCSPSGDGFSCWSH